MTTDSTIVGYKADIYGMDEVTTVSLPELDCVGFEVPEGMTVSGRINQSQPRMAVLDGGANTLTAAMRAAAKHRCLFEADFSELEERILYLREPIPMMMEEDMTRIYKRQVDEVDHLRFHQEIGYTKERGRKNSRWGSRVAKDHRSATKRQRATRKKNRK